jgi:hypothetical protein
MTGIGIAQIAGKSMTAILTLQITYAGTVLMNLIHRRTSGVSLWSCGNYTGLGSRKANILAIVNAAATVI